MSLLSRSMRLLDKTLKNAAAEDIAYSRGEDSFDLQAVPGRNVAALYGIDGEQGSEIVFDWIITAAELLLDGEKVEPADGDTIVWVNGGIMRTFDVLPDSGDRCFRVVDQLGILLRVHTKLRSEVVE